MATLSALRPLVISDQLADVLRALGDTKSLSETHAQAIILLAKANPKIDQAEVDRAIAKLARPGVRRLQVIDALAAELSKTNLITESTYRAITATINDLSQPGDPFETIRPHGTLDLSRFAKSKPMAAASPSARRTLSRKLFDLWGRPRADVVAISEKLPFVKTDFAEFERKGIQVLARENAKLIAVCVVGLLVVTILVAATTTAKAKPAEDTKITADSPIADWKETLSEAVNTVLVKFKDTIVVVCEHRQSADTYAVLTKLPLSASQIVLVDQRFGLPAHGLNWYSKDDLKLLGLPADKRVVIVNMHTTAEHVEQLRFQDTTANNTLLAVTMPGRSTKNDVNDFLNEARRETDAAKLAIALRKAESVCTTKAHYAKRYRTEALWMKGQAKPSAAIEPVLIKLIANLDDSEVNEMNPADYGVTKSLAELAPMRVRK